MTALVPALILSAFAASPPATSTAPAASTEIQQVVERAFKQYEAAQSYQDVLVLTSQFEAETPLRSPEPAEASLAFARPNKLSLQTEHYRLVADGEKLWEVADVWMEYTESVVPTSLRLGDLSLNQFGFFRDGKHPLLPLILEGDRSSLDVLSDKAQLTAVRPDALNGLPGKRVTGTMGRTQEVAVEIWFDDASGLIGEVVYDHTKAAQASAPHMKIRKIVQRLSFKDARMNQPITGTPFAFAPEKRLEKVAKLRMPSSHEMQQRLTGLPAPVFTGKYLDGKSGSHEDFKGRVVLLDFWSLRCGPCIMSMPTLVRLAEKYADKPVSVVGVNLDGPSASARVNQMLVQAKVKFPNLIETKPSLAEKYFVEGIPCTVLIDGKGVIQSVHLGMADERDLSTKIDRLLKGESLVSPK